MSSEECILKNAIFRYDNLILWKILFSFIRGRPLESPVFYTLNSRTLHLPLPGFSKAARKVIYFDFIICFGSYIFLFFECCLFYSQEYFVSLSFFYLYFVALVSPYYLFFFSSASIYYY